jgi:phosphatidylserine/phosphatidylglycerophosphate/cardiolipin synthase-like enzyme
MKRISSANARIHAGLLAAGLLAWAVVAPAFDVPAPQAIPATGTVQVAFPPWDNAEALVLGAIRHASSEILVQAYSFTSRSIARALVAAHRRGVVVRVLADSEQTQQMESSQIPELAAAGIRVSLETRYQSAHSKVIVIDAGTAAETVLTGSYNWTYAAQSKNAENLIVLRGNAPLTRAYRENWLRHAAEAQAYEPGR